MIEVVFHYDFIPGYDESAYTELVLRATSMMVDSEGFVEFRAHRNMLGSPQVRRTSVWESMDAWSKLVQKSEFQEINEEFRTFVTNLDVQVWGPSPLTPEPVTTKV